MPVTQQVHIDQALTNISVGYKNEEFIADKIFKTVYVDKQSDRYYVYGKERFRINDDRRTPGSEANEIDWTLSDDTYYCDGHALRHSIPVEQTKNADKIFDLETEATELVTEGILINKEVDAANKLLDPNSYHPDLVFTFDGATRAKWSDYNNSFPHEDIEKAKEEIHKKSGLTPNTLILSRPVFNKLKFHPKLRELLSLNDRGIITVEMLKSIFDVPNILIGSALKSTVVDKNGNDTLGYIWGNSAVLAYIPERPGKKIPALGYSFEWKMNGNLSVAVYKWFEEGKRATIVEVERYYDQKIVSNVAGALLADVI